MGKIKYPDLDKKVYMFAKANYDKGEAKNVYYEHELFMYPFENQEFPDYIGIVPVVKISEEIMKVDDLNKLYDEYRVQKTRLVEGFIVAQNNNVNKYVRMKNGNLQDHHE